MLRKVFKTILVLSLCAGLTIPTNAAVSVSDGSAFVTKAEFAADLNNLSNRMAQLENSLDAKIDSLVSSYLTRNGIWNGANQTLNKTRCETPYSSRKYDGTAADASNKNPGNNLYDRWEYLIVNECNKTGMAYIRFEHEYDFDGSGTVSGTGDNMAYVGAAFAVSVWTGTNRTFSTGCRWGWHYFYYVNTGHSEYGSACLFFVSKTQPIYLYTYHYTSPNNVTDPRVYVYMSEFRIKEVLIY